VRLTDALCGRVIEAVLRHEDGTVAVVSTCGRTLRLGAHDGRIRELPRTLVVVDRHPTAAPPHRLRLLESFLCERIDFVLQEDAGTVTFSCSSGRQITLQVEPVRGRWVISDVPKVGCVIALPGLRVFGDTGGGAR
jgi:hypothetical protein